jgi:hypothetical protein
MKAKNFTTLQEAYVGILENRLGMPTSHEVYEPEAEAKEFQKEINEDPKEEIFRLKKALESWAHTADILVEALEFEGKDWEKEMAKKHAIAIYRDAVENAKF